MKYLKIFEEYVETLFDNNGKFIFIIGFENITTKSKTYVFVWNLRKMIDDNKKVFHSDSISFTYKCVKSRSTTCTISIENLNKNETFEFDIHTKRIEPKYFYEKNPKMCVELYNTVKNKLEDFPQMPEWKIKKFNKLLDTLYNIENLRLKIEAEKYNL